MKRLVAATVLSAALIVPAAPADAGPYRRSDCNRYIYLLQANGLPVATFKRFMWRESGCRPDARHVNRNGTVDRCLLQINSIHLRKGGVAEGYAPAQLYQPRICIRVAAKLYKRYGMRPWR
jgi:soluble lytic murein transglycosylase-like protein